MYDVGVPFQSGDAYRRYERSVLHTLRYMHEESVRDFLRAVQETSVSRIQVLGSGTYLWRAQLGNDYRVENRGTPEELEVACGFPPERMKPDPVKVREGRVNPRGIAYLYLAVDERTACAEVRPWLGSYISLGLFRTNRDLRVVDCTQDKKRWQLKFNPVTFKPVPWTPEEYESVVWGDIAYSMSEPVLPEDSGLSYVPTQIIAESLRHNGADGIAYRSLLGEKGTNIALFNIEDAELVRCGLMETSKIQFTFDQADNPYFVKRSDQSPADTTPAGSPPVPAS